VGLWGLRWVGRGLEAGCECCVERLRLWVGGGLGRGVFL